MSGGHVDIQKTEVWDVADIVARAQNADRRLVSCFLVDALVEVVADEAYTYVRSEDGHSVLCERVVHDVDEVLLAVNLSVCTSQRCHNRFATRWIESPLLNRIEPILQEQLARAKTIVESYRMSMEALWLELIGAGHLTGQQIVDGLKPDNVKDMPTP